MNLLLEILLLIAIIFVVGLISSFTNNKREQFQLLLHLVLPAAFIASGFLIFYEWWDIIPSTGTVYDVVVLGGLFLSLFLISGLILVASFYLGTLISSIILFIKRKSGEKLEADEV